MNKPIIRIIALIALQSFILTQSTWAVPNTNLSTIRKAEQRAAAADRRIGTQEALTAYKADKLAALEAMDLGPAVHVIDDTRYPHAEMIITLTPDTNTDEHGYYDEDGYFIVRLKGHRGTPTHEGAREINYGFRRKGSEKTEGEFSEQIEAEQWKFFTASEIDTHFETFLQKMRPIIGGWSSHAASAGTPGSANAAADEDREAFDRARTVRTEGGVDALIAQRPEGFGESGVVRLTREIEALRAELDTAKETLAQRTGLHEDRAEIGAEARHSVNPEDEQRLVLVRRLDRAERDLQRGRKAIEGTDKVVRDAGAEMSHQAISTKEAEIKSELTAVRQGLAQLLESAAAGAAAGVAEGSGQQKPEWWGNEEHMQRLRAQLVDPRGIGLRYPAAEILGGIGTPEAVEILGTALNDEAVIVRHTAIESLVRIGTPEAERVLREALKFGEEAFDRGVPYDKDRIEYGLRRIQFPATGPVGIVPGAVGVNAVGGSL